MFDLPVAEPEDRKLYTKFHKLLIREGFSMLQYSVYARFCASEETAAAHRRRIRHELPPRGQVRLLAVTDRQFGKMEVRYGKTVAKSEEPPPQLPFF